MEVGAHERAGKPGAGFIVMDRSVLRIVICAAALFTACANAGRGDTTATGASQQITRAGTQASTAGPMDQFSGRVRVDRLSPANGAINASTAYVTFEPGARSAWHTHPRGQYLVVTAGMGLAQQWGKPVQEIRPGDVVWCPPGIKHWHGAAPTTAMTHLAVTGTADGKSVSWMEKLTDAQYNAVASPAAATEGRETMTTEPLSAKQQTIPLIAAFMATSDLPRLNATLNEGLDAGLTISECKEVLVQLYAYTGFPRSLNALSELMKVLEARKQRGDQDRAGPRAQPSHPRRRRAGGHRESQPDQGIRRAGWGTAVRLRAGRSTSSCRRICSATSSSATTSTGRAASWPPWARWPPHRAWSPNCARTWPRACGWA
jgi:quercetin dioxygenase-like cupin family protein